MEQGYKVYLNGKEIEGNNFSFKEIGVDLKNRLIKFPKNKHDIHISELKLCDDTSRMIQKYIANGSKKRRLPRKLKKKLVKIFGFWEVFLDIKVIGI